MSEFPEWIERQVGWNELTYQKAQELHRKIAIVYELIPDIDELMRRGPDRTRPWWKRYLWYVAHA